MEMTRWIELTGVFAQMLLRHASACPLRHPPLHAAKALRGVQPALKLEMCVAEHPAPLFL
jgi:hypothetical protein